MLSRALLFLVITVASCSVTDSGLGPLSDAGAGGVAGVAVCPAGLVDKGNWPVASTYTSCSEPCGPDSPDTRGVRTCSQVAKATCQASAGCVCVDSLCVSCGICSFPSLPECYVPTNVASAAQAPSCAKTVRNGGSCSPACARQLCMQADGKTGCVCNAKSKYACAAWGETSWK